MQRTLRLTGIGLCAVSLAIGVAGCSKPTSAGSTGGASTGGGAARAAPKSDKHLSIGFFGFAKANSFAQAGWAGVQSYAKAHNASATFVDSNFAGPAQANAVQDAVTSKKFDVIILQANDGQALVNPVKQAVAAGITVVVEFTPIGGDYASIKPQVPGTINLIDPPVTNGKGLAKMAVGACKSLKLQPAKCNVAYFQGFANYPLDSARTTAAVNGLKAEGMANVWSNQVGGYTADTGRTAMQNLLQAHPDVNVVIGSSQALEGATPLATGTKITFIGNGGSTQAFNYIKKGTWYGAYVVPEKSEGAKAAELGLTKARGGSVPTATNTCTALTDYDCLGTAKTLKGKTADYSD
jgi:ribose transport system substrate-binding protein